MVRKEKLEEIKNIMEEFKTVKVEKIDKKNKFIKSEAHKYYLNDGSNIVREKLIKGNNNGSAAIIIRKLSNGEFLTIVEPRVFTELTVGVGFPAGYIEKGEDAKVAALRELEEEVGYSSDYLVELDSFYQDEGCSEALNRIYLALDCKKVGEQHLDAGEKIKYLSLNLDELLELEKMKVIRGCNTKLALQLLVEAEILGNAKDTNENIRATEEKYKTLKKIYEKEN